MTFRGAYHQAIVEEHAAIRQLRAMMFSGGLLVFLLLVLVFSFAMLWWLR